MKTHIFIILLLILSSSISAQETYYTKTGTIDFFSSTPLEDIKAVNNEVVSILKTESGELTFGLMINSFKFENGLMEEHFNENYMESEKYPKAKFEGKIENIDEVDFKTNGTYTVNVTGKINIHGVIRKLDPTVAKIIVNNEEVSAVSFIRLKPEDFQIEIPALVRDNIAKIIDVNIKVNYEIYGK